MLNNTVNGDVKSSKMSINPNKKKFKPAGRKNNTKVVVVEIRQEDKEKIRSLKTGTHVAIPTLVTNYIQNVPTVNEADFLQAGEFVSIKAYPGNREDMEKAKQQRDKQNSRDEK